MWHHPSIAIHHAPAAQLRPQMSANRMTREPRSGTENGFPQPDRNLESKRNEHLTWGDCFTECPFIERNRAVHNRGIAHSGRLVLRTARSNALASAE